MLRKEIQNIYISNEISLKLLKDCPSAIPRLAEWTFEAWQGFDATLTKEKLTASLSKRLNDDKIPFTLVALKGGEPIGMVSLKDKPEEELSDFPKDIPWLGSLHVLPEERKKGLGGALVQAVKTLAKTLGHEKILFYTSNPKNIDWYQKRGAQILETRIFRGHPITIMQCNTAF